jgi:sn-glycerol 3-phosphate transport system substrate-binding protein
MNFMLWLSSQENDVRMFRRVGFVPIRSSSVDSLDVRAFLKKHPRYRIPLEALEYARSLPVHPRFLLIDREIAAMLERIVLSGADPV